jgi:hypothetical protein
MTRSRLCGFKNVRRPSGRSGRALIGLALGIVTLGVPSERLSAQVAAATVTVIGIVVDSLTGAPITGARVSLGLDGPGVASSSLGRFALPNVPVGTRAIVVSRLGYQDLEALIVVTDPMGGVRLRISPDPVQLEGVSSDTKTDDIRGRVVDADTGEPVPYATLTLTKDGIRKLGRRFRSTDTLGNFVLPNVSNGGYVLRVDRPGYGIRLQQLEHTGREDPFLIPLSRDARREAALAALTAQLDARAAAMPRAAVLREEKLQTATMTTLKDFLKFEGPPGWGFDPTIGSNESGRNAPPPAPGFFFLDGVYQYYLRPDDVSTKEFYRVDLLDCKWAEGRTDTPPAGVPSRPRVLLAYTYKYVEERMADPNWKDPKDPTRVMNVCSALPPGSL